MRPKNAIIVLSIIFFVILLSLYGLYYYKTRQSAGNNGPAKGNGQDIGQPDIKTVLSKKKSNQPLTPQEQQAFDQLVQKEVSAKFQELDKKPAPTRTVTSASSTGAIRKPGTAKYNQSDLDFIANPQKYTEKQILAE